MLAARVHGYEDHKLHLDQVPEPTIQSPLDVIVRIGGGGVCRTDLHVLEGMWDFASPGLPFIVGHENAGWVHEIGSAVTSVAVGDTVIAHSFVTCGLCRPCRRGDDAHCERAYNPGLSADGGFAEYMRTGERALLKVDPALQPAAFWHVRTHAEGVVPMLPGGPEPYRRSVVPRATQAYSQQTWIGSGHGAEGAAN